MSLAIQPLRRHYPGDRNAPVTIAIPISAGHQVAVLLERIREPPVGTSLSDRAQADGRLVLRNVCLEIDIWLELRLHRGRNLCRHEQGACMLSWNNKYDNASVAEPRLKNMSKLMLLYHFHSENTQ
jgi:hypothetical protein